MSSLPLDEKILSFFKVHPGQWLTLQEIAEALGREVSCVYAEVQQLKTLGYEFVVSSSGTALQLTQIPDRLIPFEIQWHLHTSLIGKIIYSYEIVDSTMDTLKGMVATESVKEGALVIAETQRKARGRYNRSWVCVPYQGLYFSCMLTPCFPHHFLLWITIMGAVAIADSIHKLGNVNARIKWPNDVMINDKKVAGVLVETDQSHGLTVLLGIGVNVNTEIVQLPLGATSIESAYGKKVERIALLQELLRRLDYYYGKAIAGDFNELRQRWQRYSSVIGRHVSVTRGNHILQGYVIDLCDDGQLMLRLDNGFIEILSAGDVIIER